MFLLSGRKYLLSLSILFLALLFLCGCAGSAEAEAPASSVAPETTPAPAQTPTPTETPAVKLGIKTYSADTKSIDLSREDVSFEELCAAAPALENVKALDIGLTEFTAEQIETLTALYPDADLRWEITLLGKSVPSDTPLLSLPDITEDDVPEVCRALEMLPRLETVELLPPEGATPLTSDEIDMIAASAHGARIDCRFELYGQLAGPETEELRYNMHNKKRNKIGDEGIALFRAALPYLHSLKLLRLQECGITDNDAMAALRADFPDANVVWSIEIAGSPFMTDTTLIHTPLLRDRHVHLLQYFPDVLYFDIGHNHYLTSIDFLKYLPKLTVCILAITRITDISPLENCPDLEFLEIFSTPVEDISVLAKLTKLEYLNIGTMPNLKDISPVFELKNLKMVRICGSSFDHVRKEQVAELKAALPNCFVSDGKGDPTTAGGWRYDENHNYTPRYALLRQQMLYYKANWKDRQSNSPSA